MKNKKETFSRKSNLKIEILLSENIMCGVFEGRVMLRRINLLISWDAKASNLIKWKIWQNATSETTNESRKNKNVKMSQVSKVENFKFVVFSAAAKRGLRENTWLTWCKVNLTPFVCRIYFKRQNLGWS